MPGVNLSEIQIFIFIVEPPLLPRYNGPVHVAAPLYFDATFMLPGL